MRYGITRETHHVTVELLGVGERVLWDGEVDMLERDR